MRIIKVLTPVESHSKKTNCKRRNSVSCACLHRFQARARSRVTQKLWEEEKKGEKKQWKYEDKSKTKKLHPDSKVLQLRVTQSPLKPINWAFKCTSFWIIISGGQQLEGKKQKCAFPSRCAVTNDVQAEGFTSYEAAFTSIAQSPGVPPAHEWREKKILKNNRLEVGPKLSVQLKKMNWKKKQWGILGFWKWDIVTT